MINKPTRAQLELLRKVAQPYLPGTEFRWPMDAFRRPTLEVCMKNGWVKQSYSPYYHNSGWIQLTAAGKEILKQLGDTDG